MADIDPEAVRRLGRLVFETRVDIFRRVPTTDKPAADNIDWLLTKMNPDASMGRVKARPRQVLSEKIEWLRRQTQQLTLVGMLRLDWHTTTCSSVAMGVPNRRGYRMMSDYPAANAQVESGPWPTRVVAEASSRFREVPVFCSFDLLRGSWQKILSAEEAQDFLYECFTFRTALHSNQDAPGHPERHYGVFKPTIIEIVQGIHPERREMQAGMVDNVGRLLERLQGRSL